MKNQHRPSFEPSVQRVRTRVGHARGRRLVFAVSCALIALVISGCGSSDSTSAAGTDCPTIVLATHDSFGLSDSTLATFTDDTCIEVDVVSGGDAGELVSAAILNAGNPTADVLFGVDTTFVQRAVDAEVFEPYTSRQLSQVDPKLRLDQGADVTPISFSDVCVNYWIDALPGDPPSDLDALIDPAYRGQFVTQNPETSSPGFAFLLTTIDTYGEDGWQEYWQALVDNDLAIANGWTESYYGEFVAGGGDRSMVTSYASSPPAEVLFADSPIDEPPTGVLEASCFRQVEFAGILRGTNEPKAAQALIDFMLSDTYQSDIALNQFVYPANRTIALPEVFEQFGKLASAPVQMAPADIEANRDRWTEQWAQIVLG